MPELVRVAAIINAESMAHAGAGHDQKGGEEFHRVHDSRVEWWSVSVFSVGRSAYANERMQTSGFVEDLNGGCNI